MSSRPCLDCGALSSESRCPRHRRSTFNYKLRGSGGRAATFRRRALAKTDGACAVCGSRDRVQAHHVGPSDENGGVALCRAHHVRVTRAEAGRRKAASRA